MLERLVSSHTFGACQPDPDSDDSISDDTQVQFVYYRLRFRRVEPCSIRSDVVSSFPGQAATNTEDSVICGEDRIYYNAQFPAHAKPALESSTKPNRKCFPKFLTLHCFKPYGGEMQGIFSAYAASLVLESLARRIKPVCKADNLEISDLVGIGGWSHPFLATYQ